jgi:predicted TIM-barrel fold metal-dependent hydrolase
MRVIDERKDLRAEAKERILETNPARFYRLAGF